MQVCDRATALTQLGILTESLAYDRVQLADLESQAHRIRVETWVASDSEYISARDRMADFNAVDLTCEILTLKGEIAATEDKRMFYALIVEWT